MTELTKEDLDILEMIKKDREERAKIPESEKIVLDSPKFTKHAIGIGDDGKPFTDEDVKRNNEILFGKDKSK